jgi:hypothetical protein
VDEPSQHVTPSDADSFGRRRWIALRLRRFELETPMRPGPVVVGGVGAEHPVGHRNWTRARTTDIERTAVVGGLINEYRGEAALSGTQGLRPPFLSSCGSAGGNPQWPKA